VKEHKTEERNKKTKTKASNKRSLKHKLFNVEEKKTKRPRMSTAGMGRERAFESNGLDENTGKDLQGTVTHAFSYFGSECTHHP